MSQDGMRIERRCRRCRRLLYVYYPSELKGETAVECKCHRCGAVDRNGVVPRAGGRP